MGVLATAAKIEWTNPAGSAQDQRVDATIKPFPDKPAKSELLTSKWVGIYDLYKSTVTIGGKLKFVAHGVETLFITDDIKDMDPANPERPEIPIIILPPNTSLTIEVYVNANTGTTDATESATAKIVFGDSYDEVVNFIKQQLGK